MPEEILVREQYGLLGKEKIYTKHLDRDSIVELVTGVQTFYGFGGIITNFFREVFLPQGYPDSVSKDYLAYQIWDTIQAFCSTLMSTLTTHSIMKGVGVGDTAATPLAAAVTWIMKDGTGMVSRIMFAWWKGCAHYMCARVGGAFEEVPLRRACRTCLDADCKKWRLVADGLNDAALCLEMCLPLVTAHSTALLCTSTAIKAVVGVAGGATRAAVTQHQAIRNNMGDVSAKDGSQETLVNLCASLTGITILSTVVPDGMHAWLLFMFFAISHLFANYMAVHALQMTSLNEERLLLLLKTFILTKIAATPRGVQFKEAVILGTGQSATKLCGHEIVIGTSLKKAIKNNITANDLKFLIKQYEPRDYLHIEDLSHRIIYIVLRKNITPVGVLQAYFHAVLYGIAVAILDEEDLPHLTTSKDLYEKSTLLLGLRSALIQTRFIKYPHDLNITVKATMAANHVVNQNFTKFLAEIETRGWQTDTLLLSVDEWRGDW